MIFSQDVCDVPARIHAYLDAGYDRTKATTLARADMLSASQEVLDNDYASPVSLDIDRLEVFPTETDSHRHDRLCNELDSAEEYHALLSTMATHKLGMTDRAYGIVRIAFKNIVKESGVVLDVPKMEAIHAEGISPKQLTLHMEDASKFSIKEMWKKMKNFFINTFNKIKSWYIKAWDATSRLGKKAAAVKANAEAKQGVMTNPSFSFSGLKQLSINNKVPDPVGLTASIASISTITQGMLGTTAATYNKLTENMSKILEDLIGKAKTAGGGSNASTPTSGTANNATTANGGNGGQNTTQAPTGAAASNFNLGDSNTIMMEMNKRIEEIKKILGGTNGLEVWAAANSDERFKALATGGSAQIYKSSQPLPGDKMVVVSVPNIAASDSDGVKSMKQAFGATVESINPKPRELDDTADFKTLNTNQIVSICDSVMDGCKAGLDYKLLFDQRDKAFQNLTKGLENTVNQAENLEGAASSFIKANVTACTQIFNKINSGEGRWFKYAMGVFTKGVDYCQKSLNEMT